MEKKRPDHDHAHDVMASPAGLRRAETYRHFSTIAHRFDSLRTTDATPAAFVTRRLPRHERVRAADVGCGAGRYDILLLRLFGERLHLICIDENEAMLREFATTVARLGYPGTEVVRAEANALPFSENTLDAIVTFNAVHHFDVPAFLREVSRILVGGARLFIYTRLRSQNRSTIWGRYFPGFCEKERRLFELPRLKRLIANSGSLELEELEHFRFRRTAPLERLIHQARGHHYSTFALYDKEELEEALERFEYNLSARFEARAGITWYEENVMFVVRKDPPARGFGQKHPLRTIGPE